MISGEYSTPDPRPAPWALMNVFGRWRWTWRMLFRSSLMIAVGMLLSSWLPEISEFFWLLWVCKNPRRGRAYAPCVQDGHTTCPKVLLSSHDRRDKEILWGLFGKSINPHSWPNESLNGHCFKLLSLGVLCSASIVTRTDAQKLHLISCVEQHRTCSESLTSPELSFHPSCQPASCPWCPGPLRTKVTCESHVIPDTGQIPPSSQETGYPDSLYLLSLVRKQIIQRILWGGLKGTGGRGGRCYQHLVGWGQKCCETSCNAQDSSHNKASSPDISRAQAETPCYRVFSEKSWHWGPATWPPAAALLSTPLWPGPVTHLPEPPLHLPN